jgi:hypothetical protein
MPTSPEEVRFLEASVKTRDEAVRVAMLTLPSEETWNTEEPEEEATLNGFKVPVPCTLKETVEEEALTPTTEPLSIKVDVASVVEFNQRVA